MLHAPFKVRRGVNIHKVFGPSYNQRSTANEATRALVASMRRTSGRSEEHTSELQSLMRISYAVFCLKKKKTTNIKNNHTKIFHKILTVTNTITIHKYDSNQAIP